MRQFAILGGVSEGEPLLGFISPSDKKIFWLQVFVAKIIYKNPLKKLNFFGGFIFICYFCLV